MTDGCLLDVIRVREKDEVKEWLEKKRIQRDRRLVAGAEYI